MSYPPVGEDLNFSIPFFVYFIAYKLHLYQCYLHNIAHMVSFLDLCSVMYIMLCFKILMSRKSLTLLTSKLYVQLAIKLSFKEKNYLKNYKFVAYGEIQQVRLHFRECSFNEIYLTQHGKKREREKQSKTLVRFVLEF